MTLTTGDSWLSPTRAWRLVLCPASGQVAGQPRQLEPDGANAGSIAHLALKAWIEAGDWHREDGGASLASWYDRLLDRAGLDAPDMRDGRMTQARLRVRADGIRDWLLHQGALERVDCEVELRDEARKLFGTPDISVPIAPGAILDLKTGRQRAAGLPESAQLQLLFYSHLFETTHGYLPRTVVAASLVRGLVPVEAGREAVARVLEMIDKARADDAALARPQPDTCRFCRRRSTCEPHWDAVTEWDAPDAVQGSLTEIVESENGMSAVRLEGPALRAWIYQVGPGVLPQGAAMGQQLRAVRVTRDRRSDPDGVEIWRAGPLTELYVAP